MSLFRAERRRLVKRRSTKIMVAVAIALLGAVVATISLTSHRPDAAAYAAAEREAQRVYEEQRGYTTQAREQCEREKAAAPTASPGADGSGKGSTAMMFPGDCSEIQDPPRDDFRAEHFLPYLFHFQNDFDDLLTIFAGVLVLTGFVIAASFIGAEWNSGSMMNLLLWRPRRISVLLTKLGTLLGVTLVTSTLLAALWTGAFWLIGKYRGTLGTLTPGYWRSIGLSEARAIGFVLIAAAIGFALASIGRHTGAALGVGIGVLLVSEIGVSTVLGIAGSPLVEQWLISTYVEALMRKRVLLQDFSVCNNVQGECRPMTDTITWVHSSWLFGITAVVLVAAAMWWIRRRDVA